MIGEAEAEALEDSILENAPPPRRLPGRPKKRGTETTITKRDITDEEEEDKTPLTFAALFDPGPDDTNAQLVVRVRVVRVDPNEGMLDYITDMDATEAAIKEQWGGSVYRLDGLNKQGKIVRVKTIRIGGDPLFVGEAAEIQWRRQRGLGRKQEGNGSGNGGMSPQDMLAMIDAREEKRRIEERERDEKKRAEEKEMELRRRTEEREWKAEREDAARKWEESKRKEDEYREDKRRKDDDAREDRRRRDATEAEQRQQAHQAHMLAMVQESAKQSLQFVRETAGKQDGGNSSLIEAVKVIASIKEAFGNDGGGGDGEIDPLSMLMKHGGEWLNGLGNAVTGAIREVKGNTAPVALPQAARPALLAGIPEGSPLAAKVETLVTKIAERGHDPEKVLAALLDNSIATLDGQGPVAARPAQAPVAGSIVSPALPVRASSSPDPVAAAPKLPKAKRISFV